MTILCKCQSILMETDKVAEQSDWENGLNSSDACVCWEMIAGLGIFLPPGDPNGHFYVFLLTFIV